MNFKKRRPIALTKKNYCFEKPSWLLWVFCCCHLLCFVCSFDCFNTEDVIGIQTLCSIWLWKTFFCSKYHPILFCFVLFPEEAEIHKFWKQDWSSCAWRLSVKYFADVKRFLVVSQDYGEKTPACQGAKHKHGNSTVPEERDRGLKNWHNETRSTEKQLVQLL